MASPIRQKKFATRENLIYLIFASTYLHFAVTALVGIVTGIVLFARKDFRKQIFVHRGCHIFILFSVAGVIMAAVHGNWLGVACSAGVLLVLIIGFWIRSVMRRGVMERALSYCCMMSIGIMPCAVIERLFFVREDMRCCLWFFNPNYMATMCMIAFAFCVYKLLNGKGHLWIYITGIICNTVSMYLSGSLFIWVDVFIVTALLLVLFKKWPTIAVLLGVMAAFCMVLYFSPELLPRSSAASWTTGTRFSVWSAAIEEIKKSPFFGRGFLTYMQICGDYPGAFVTHHTHNIIVDPLLNFGIVGTSLLLPYFIFYFVSLKRCYEHLVCRNTTHLILALSVTILVHGLIDITFMWIQTGLLLVLVMGGLGMDEKLLKRLYPNQQEPFLNKLKRR